MPSIIKKFFKILSVLLALALLIFALVFGTLIYINSSPDIARIQGILLRDDDTSLRLEEGNVLFLEVRNGESAISVGKRLEEAGIIRSQYLWRILPLMKNDFIKTGTYKIELPTSQLNIYSLLVQGSQILVRVTIPEGVTLKKTAAILEQAGICGAEEFLAAASSKNLRDQYQIPGETMEGYLYPDTYLFPLSYPPEKVVQNMADTFFARLAEIAPESLFMETAEINNRVILASIVEREYRVKEEAAIMAGVFYNRLRINMALQSCATVEYVITEIQGRPHPAVLYNRDLEIRDSYNTYIYPGLPPGPISAPGANALGAAFYPSTTDYFYFRLTDPEAGRHYFSRTLDDHIQAGALIPKGY
jgi:UPF0755 protein